MKLIHLHENGKGGIGDFIRASLGLYYLSKKLNYLYYVDFANPLLKTCFVYKKYNYTNEDYVLIEKMGGITNDNIENYLLSLEKNKCYIIYCNLIGFVKLNEINTIIDEYNTNILKPSNLVEEHINMLMKSNNLIKKEYISCHIRCGDYTMGKNTDYRIDINNNQIYGFINSKIEKYLDKIIINTDSIYLKNKMKDLYPNYIYLDINIKHIAENIGSETQEAYISTISEFYIVSYAKEIIAITYSGFSHIASIIGKTKLICDDNDHVSCLHP